ncbi:hypothetical protein V6N13_089505 [Hibiscus sabdariffa]|uniref:Uncharacterized protein n=1 Tax=Hibiscus sabdariffa TaxID=183260 RepID=A0ABR2QJP3_9ROSI
MRSIILATQRITYGERAHLVSKDCGALVATRLLSSPKSISFHSTRLDFVTSVMLCCKPSSLQVPGRVEADFGRLDGNTQELYYVLQKCTPVAADDNPEIMDLVNSSAPRLPRFSEEDIAGSELRWKLHTGKTEAGLIMLE